MLGNPPPTCPVCRSRALTFHEIEPFYWELLDVDQVLPAVAAGVTEVEGICAGVAEAQARRGLWPMREIVAHLLGAERLAVGRAVRVLEEDGPELATVSWTDTVADHQTSMADLLARLRDELERTLSRLARSRPSSGGALAVIRSGVG